MLQADEIKDVFDCAKRSTVYGALDACQDIFLSIMPYTTVSRLKILSHNKSITWNILHRLLLKALQNRDNNHIFLNLLNLFESRAQSEKYVKSYLESCETGSSKAGIRLYYELENKNLKNILSYIDCNYSYNIGRIIDKYGYMFINKYRVDSNVYDYFMALNKFHSNGHRINSLTFSNHEIRLNLLEYITNLDVLLENVKLLEPNTKSIPNIDILYNVILYLKSSASLSAKTHPYGRISVCSVCWRPAIVRCAKKKYSCYCPMHLYETTDGLQAHKRDYQDALEVSKIIKSKYHFKRMELINNIFKNLVNADVGRGALLISWKWWNESPTTEYISEHVWKYIPNVLTYLNAYKTDLTSKESVIRILMPLPSNANELERDEYEVRVAGWVADFRYFVPILADAELWLQIYSKLIQNKKQKYSDFL